MEEFNLQEGEKVIEEIKPVPKLKKRMFVGDFIMFFFMIAAFSMVLIPFIIIAAIEGGLGFIFITITIFIGVAAVISLIVSKWSSGLRYGKLHYWITNKRLITKRGFIGYRTGSIPLERISDVIVAKSFLDRAFDVTGLYVQSLAGQYGVEGRMPGISEPLKTQDKILALIKKKRKEEGITM